MGGETMTAYRIDMQASCPAERATDVGEYLQVIPGFYAIAQPGAISAGRLRIDFSIVVREEVQEGTLLGTAEERVSQYLRQRPDLQPLHVTALASERLPEDEAVQMPPDYIPPQRSL
jgi:hypothetical protein